MTQHWCSFFTQQTVKILINAVINGYFIIILLGKGIFLGHPVTQVSYCYGLASVVVRRATASSVIIFFRTTMPILTKIWHKILQISWTLTTPKWDNLGVKNVKLMFKIFFSTPWNKSDKLSTNINDELGRIYQNCKIMTPGVEVLVLRPRQLSHILKIHYFS